MPLGNARARQLLNALLPCSPVRALAMAAGATAGRAPSRAGRPEGAGHRDCAGFGHRAACRCPAERGLGLRSALGPAGGRAGGWLALGARWAGRAGGRGLRRKFKKGLPVGQKFKIHKLKSKKIGPIKNF